MYECKRAPTHHCFTCQGLAQCMAAAGVTRLAALLAWDRGTQPGATYYRIQNQHNPAVVSEKDLINDKCEPKTERRHGKCGQGDQSPFKFGYSPLQVFQLSLIRARHHHCSRPTKLANRPPISAEVFRPNRRVRPVTASGRGSRSGISAPSYVAILEARCSPAQKGNTTRNVRPHGAKHRRWDLVPRCHHFSA